MINPINTVKICHAFCKGFWKHLMTKGIEHPLHLVPIIFGSSVIGPSHEKKNIKCQDACCYELLNHGIGVIVVSDGLGSVKNSDIGATEAVNAAVNKIKEIFNTKGIEGAHLDNIVENAVFYARQILEQKADELQCNLQDLACTIIVVVIYQDTVSVGHIGDGAVVAKIKDKLKIISYPGESEYVNEVVPLTSKDWDKHLRISGSSEIECLAVFTDGCQKAGLKKMENIWKPYNGFFDPLFLYAKEIKNIKEAKQDIINLLISEKMSKNSEDDKTFVIAVLKN